MKSLRWMKGGVMVLTLLLGTVSPALAQDAETPPIDTGDTAWLLTSAGLVLLMTIPALALFYGGLVRSKNVLSTLMHSVFCAGLISVTWVVYGYSIAFGEDIGGLIGWDPNLIGLKGLLGTRSELAPTVPQLVFVAFQMTFAIITPALISGAFAERIRFPAFAALTLLWSTLIYLPLCHWVWGGGWIGTKIGALDFAGGTVVHISSGISALVTAIYLGKRLGYGHEPMAPHNLPFTVIGAAMLWVGWFGFNAGSALGANDIAAIAFINTNSAAAAAMLGWLIVEWLRTGKPTILGAASGAVAGLVVITPAAGFVTPLGSIVMGLIGGAVCYAAVSLKPRLGYDDALDVVGVHMVGGTLGAILTGVFASTAVNDAIPGLALTDGLTGGLLHGGGFTLLKAQVIATVATYAFCGIGTLLILVVVDALFKLRASEEEEIPGLDLSQHSERGYHIGSSEAVAIVASPEPRPASIPPISWDRFTVAVEGLDPNQLAAYWRTLCQDNGPAPSPAFKSVYAHVSTIRGNRFRFRGGDPEAMRASLEQIFRAVSPAVRATVERVEGASSKLAAVTAS